MQGDNTNGYTVEVSVTPAAYVAQYNTDQAATHTLAPTTQGAKSITLVYNKTAKAWQVKADTAPVTYTVVCETPVPEYTVSYDANGAEQGSAPVDAASP